MALLAPHFGADQTPDAVEAEPGYRLPAGQPVILRAQLYLDSAGSIEDAKAIWQALYGGTVTALGPAGSMPLARTIE